MTFRISSIKVDDDNYQTDVIDLVNNKNDTKPNHFSLIVGNNGTGKSRLLGSIARRLSGFHNKKGNLNLFSQFEVTNNPSKVISVSNSLSDKFPLDRAWHSRGIEGLNYRDERYNYLGSRSRMGNSSTFLIRRSIDILLENYSNENVSKCYRHVFSYLDYHPIIKLEYKISLRDITKFPGEEIQPSHLMEHLIRRSNYSIYKDLYKNTIEKYGSKFSEVCDFLNSLRLEDFKSYELEINFSSENIDRIVEDRKLYEDDFRIYEILDILRKLGMINSFEVKLFKNNDYHFSFSDASSGEANILTTLIALIPLVEDNCCVLIDEPELSLHPSWQYRYIELLNKIFENFKGCHIIIASHSHFIVSDLPIANSSVVSLKKEKGKIQSYLLPDSTFGWSAEDILLNVFNMPTTRNYYVANIVSEALELIGDNKKRQNRFKELKVQLLYIYPNLKDEDPLKLVIGSILKV